MFNYLKKILFSLLILMLPYMNAASNAMYEDARYDDTPAITHKLNVVQDDQNSWTSSAKKGAFALVRAPYDAMNWAVQNPTQAAFIAGLLYLDPVAAYCACYCFNNGTPKFYGVCASDMAGCTYACSQIGFSPARCIPNDKGCKG